MMKIFIIVIGLIALWSSECSAALFKGGGVEISTQPRNIINLATTNLVALYSVIQQTNYSGACLRVQRSTDNAQQDIGFVDGICDIVSAMSFAGGGTARVVKWYDQSGNGRNSTQSTFTRAPVLSNTNLINSIPGITFPISSRTQLSIPSSVSVSTQSQTVISIQSMIAPRASLGAVWQIGSTAGTKNALVPLVNNDVISDPSSSLNTSIYSLSQPQVSVLTSSASTKTYQMNSILRTGLAASSAQTSTGGSIGSAFYGQVYLLAVYSSVVRQSTIDTSVASLQSTFRIVTNPAAWIVFDGDSITEGLLTTLGVNNPFQLAPQLNHSVWMRNIGISGQTLATSLANETVRVVNAFNPTITKNIVVMGGGEADICNAGASATTVFNNLKIYISNAKAAGYEVVVATLIFDLNVPNGCTDGSTRDVVRQDYNTMVIANASSLGYSVVDYDSIPELQAPQTPGYSADGIHPTSAGYALMAAKLAPVINALLP